ncbi:MAG: hypothetical protein KF867_01010 [Cryobacterium sp.]|nr:hypothetical protein [Cryobacterium sp.]
MKADPDLQRMLLDLQSLDTQLNQLIHRSEKLPELAQIVELKSEITLATQARASVTGELEDAQSELKRVESDVELVESRIKKDQERMDLTSSMKDVAGLEAEIASLKSRLSELEEMELSIMEMVEEHEAKVLEANSKLESLSTELSKAEHSKNVALESIEKERQHLTANRQTIANRISPELLSLYEKQRDRYGVGASLLQHGISGASGVKLTESDLAEIRAAAPDEVMLCPDSNAILVRTPESGL